MNEEFWVALDQLVSGTRLLIDRPRGSAHPRYPEMIYPLDYGYLDGTKGGDGAGIDVWLGSLGRQVSGVICQVDLLKRDAEIKILLGCSEEDMETVLRISNESSLSSVIIKREE
jgi:inorganic pyrophosphatase